VPGVENRASKGRPRPSPPEFLPWFGMAQFEQPAIERHGIHPRSCKRDQPLLAVEQRQEIGLLKGNPYVSAKVGIQDRGTGGKVALRGEALSAADDAKIIGEDRAGHDATFEDPGEPINTLVTCEYGAKTVRGKRRRYN